MSQRQIAFLKDLASVFVKHGCDEIEAVEQHTDYFGSDVKGIDFSLTHQKEVGGELSACAEEVSLDGRVVFLESIYKKIEELEA